MMHMVLCHLLDVEAGSALDRGDVELADYLQSLASKAYQMGGGEVEWERARDWMTGETCPPPDMSFAEVGV